MSRKFPILKENKNEPKEYIAWDIVEPHEHQAYINHGQTLEQLAERGGLSWYEMYCLLLDQKFDEIPTNWDEQRYKKCVMRIVDLENDTKNKTQIIHDVFSERARQDKKWGEQNHTAYVWASIIGEEYGELCKAINEFGFNPTPNTERDIYTEAVQTMASCMAMLECMIRSRD